MKLPPRQSTTPGRTLALRLYRRRWRKVRSQDQLILLLQDLADRLFEGRLPRIRTNIAHDSQVRVYVQLFDRGTNTVSLWATPTLGVVNPQGGYTPLQAELCVRELFRLASSS